MKLRNQSSPESAKLSSGSRPSSDATSIVCPTSCDNRASIFFWVLNAPNHTDRAFSTRQLHSIMSEITPRGESFPLRVVWGCKAPISKNTADPWPRQTRETGSPVNDATTASISFRVILVPFISWLTEKSAHGRFARRNSGSEFSRWNAGMASEQRVTEGVVRDALFDPPIERWQVASASIPRTKNPLPLPASLSQHPR